ncbi:hypothetical protein [Myceligenerans indicum]|uniref:Uncharacterized protein n=1 Tax=Myceligenerans indicum TaxID=2593663 RepID=A0ABS1LRK8_9MICO|nr:hypothetical protein [Myceligenerans indicum]MBL0888912.1 hypothetical protein [Myceligenerans indicum]
MVRRASPGGYRRRGPWLRPATSPARTRSDDPWGISMHRALTATLATSALLVPAVLVAPGAAALSRPAEHAVATSVSAMTTAASTAATAAATPADVARRWAPIHYQDVELSNLHALPVW